MKLQDVLIGAAVGFVCGYAAKSAVEKYSATSPDTVLAKVKEALKKDGKIIGSWILMTPEKFSKNGLDYEVYKGGLTKVAEGSQKQLSFVADSSTGTIIELSEQ